MKYYDVESRILLERCNVKGESKSKKEKWDEFVKVVEMLNKMNENINFCRRNKYGILMKKYVESLDEVMISVWVNYSRFKED